MTYYNLDEKIKLNQERLEKDLKSIRDIQSSYPLFFAYLAFIGLYLSDFFIYLKNYNSSELSDVAILIFVIITSILVIISIFKFVFLLYPQEIYYDKIPKEIYNDYLNQMKEYAEDRADIDVVSETKSGYLVYLEIAVEKNFKLFVSKRRLFYHVVLYSLISLIPYIILLAIKYFQYG